MQPDTDTNVTIDDFTGPTTDEGGGEYEQYIGADAPTHNPFTDYASGILAPGGGFAVTEVSEAAAPLTVSYTLAHNLAARRQNVWNCWGSALVVGWIGDAAHQAECSDHNPDSTGVVHAIDPMVTGTHAQAVVNACLHAADLQYVIHNRTIWSATVGWAARAYTGSNPHTDHVHISGKHGSSHANHGTCVGYDLAAQNSTPAFNLCPAPKPVVPPKPKPSTTAPGTRILEPKNPDMSGDDVEFVQHFIGPKHCGAADRFYGPNTTAGVRWYQNMRGVPVTGKVDAHTWAQMGVKWHG
jgi:peptidoglycan hydrolase-like protein with peptidoglycan-binding domain